jgi:hypothetical protein
LDRNGDADDLENLPGSDLRTFDGLRHQTLTAIMSKDGKLILQSEVRDWRAQFNTSNILGRDIWFRVTVEKEGKKQNLTVAPEFRPLMATTDPDDRALDVKSVFAKVTVDKSAPEVVKYDLPKEGFVGEPLVVRAVTKVRTATQAPITQAFLIRGKAPKDPNEKIKDSDILAEGIEDPKQKDWAFVLPAQGKSEPLTVSVMFMTATGVKSAKDASVFIKPAGPPTKKLYTIKGQVVIGERPQKDLKVFLRDEKGNLKNEAKSGDKGAFVFENVEPGIYSVWSREGFQGRTGTAKVTVPDKKKELEVTVPLYVTGK